MTSKDKTSDQLMASIRKSKTGPVARKTSTKKTQKSPAADKVKKPAKKTSPAQINTTGANSYSFGSRVWPD